MIWITHQLKDVVRKVQVNIKKKTKMNLVWGCLKETAQESLIKEKVVKKKKSFKNQIKSLKDQF